MDEHRVGLKPIVRRVWAKRGERPVVEVHPRYEWIYLYGFVRPETGETSFWQCGQANTDAFNAILGGWARERGLGAERRALLVLDQAGWHISGEVVWPEGVEVAFLPPYSPELMPAERLWSLTDEPLVNWAPPSLAALDARLGERCAALSEERDRIRSLTLFHWWPTLEAGID